jgi:hypothetical protein
MIISHQHKVIFLKTRRTAGTSIEIALSRFCGDRDVIAPIDPNERFRKELSHRGSQNIRVASPKRGPKDGRPRKGIDYYNHILARRVRALIGTGVWDEYYKFCFEQNAWDKAISLYFWLTRRRDPRPTLLEFLRSENTKGEGSRLSNFSIYSIGGDLAVDHVGLYENLDFELERITALLNLPEKIELLKQRNIPATIGGTIEK